MIWFRGARRYVFALVALVVAAAGVVGTGALPWADAARRPSIGTLEWSRTRPDMIVGVTTTVPVVALSFDDGPDPRYTPAILDILDDFDVKATFFMEGDHVGSNERLARRVLIRGHEVGNHTFDHSDLLSLDTAGVKDQLDRADRAFASADIDRPTLFRPPRGRFDTDAAAAVREAGLVNAGWTHGLCIERWTRRLPPDAAMQAMLARVRPGAILLGHDGGEHDRTNTVQALPFLLQGLRDRGFRVVTVGELLALSRS